MDASNLTDAAFAGAINGDLVGSIEVPYMWRFDVYGEVQAPIEVGSPYPGGFLVLEAEKVTTGGSVLVDSGDIRRVKVYGDLLGPVVATSGAIHPNGVEADGTIGSPGSPVAITAGYGNLA